MIKTKTIFCLL